MKREDKASFLFEEFGNIDDELLTESSGRPLAALADRQQKKKRARVIALLLAASLSFSVVMLTVNYRIRQSSPPDVETTANTPSEILPEERALTEDNERAVLFSGRPSVILEEKSGDRYYYEIDRDAYDRLLTLTAENKGEKTSLDRAEKVWFTDGDGTVISPYLIFTPGNIGYGALFDYDDEVIPAKELQRELRRLTGGAAV
ncbi:MAG: hypothetical protein IJU52_00350 [Clostridia bacterium]|nr:hypothetical protein [Clostridia bacterium]